MSARDLLEQGGRRFARFVTSAVVARPRLWGVFRGPFRSLFDWLAPRWDAMRGPEWLAPLAAAVDRLGETTPARILEVGTGTGAGARLIAECYPEAEVVGVDLSPDMVEEARRLLPPELASRVRFAVADASALPFPPGSFDLVVLLNMIPFFGELARVTAPGGALVVAHSRGPETPIWTPAETLRGHLGAAGFGSFAEVKAGEGDALLAQRTEQG